MKTIWGLIVVVAIVLIGLFYWYNIFRAARQGGTNDITILAGSDQDSDLVTAGRNVNIQTQVNGDAAIAGSNVTVAGSVGGYLLAAGSNVNIFGTVGNDLWAAGSHVVVNAPITDNTMLAGNSVSLQPQASVGGNASLAGGSVEVLGPVARNLRVSAGEVKLAAEVGGTVEAYTNSLKVLPGAVLRGDLIVHSPAAPEISPEAQVLGSVQHQQEAENKRWSLLNWLGRWLFLFLALLILGAATIALSAWWTNRIAEKLIRQPGYALLAGLAGLLLIPIICVLLAITVIGLPLAAVLFAMYAVALLLSGVFVAYLIGGWLLSRLKRVEISPYARLAAGALLVAFFASLPWIGWIVQLLVLLIGLGALLLESKDAWQRQPAESPA